MFSGLGVLWRALVHLYDESLLLIRANIVWFVGSIPLFLLILAACWLFVPPTEPDEGPLVWPLLFAGLILLVVPSPFAVGIYALAAEIVTGETPPFSLYWTALRRWWRRALAMFAIGGVVLGGLLFNTAFYMGAVQGLLQAVTILWMYAMLYWISMQAYLLPLLVTADLSDPDRQVSLATLYKRAAVLTLANPFLSLAMLLAATVTMILSAVAIPIYPLVAMAYVALVGARAMRHLRQKYFPDEMGTEESAE
jgi:uncharacterized membrane protein YesL